MKAFTGVALLASAGLTSAASLGNRAAASTSQQLCSQKSYDEDGNWYCQAVDHILYTNVGKPGSFQEVVNMDQTTGACQKTTHQTSGIMAPFNDEAGHSIHFRGPLILKQFAVYTPGSKAAKRDDSHAHAHAHARARGHGQGHGHHKHNPVRFHAAEKEEPHRVQEKREHPTIWVTATIDGVVQSWTNDYWGPSDTPEAVAPAPAPTVATGAKPATFIEAKASSASSSSPSSLPATGDFVRTAYYNADQGESTGLTFLSNLGGQGSGKWTTTFGNTLAYVASTGTKGAASAQTLGNVTIPSNHEIAIMSDTPCDGSCGYVQEGSVAYKGLAPGEDKTFLFEFQMPHENIDLSVAQADQPALWLLNARIPLTQQYGGCSCWGSDGQGCGEFDILEALSPGDEKCKSTFHATFLGGDSNYFPRPVDAPVKVAVVFDSASRSVSVKILDAATDFAAALTGGQVQDFLSTDSSAGGSSGLGASLFKISS